MLHFHNIGLLIANTLFSVQSIGLVRQFYFKTKIIQWPVHVMCMFPLAAKRYTQHIIIRHVRICRWMGRIMWKLHCFEKQLKREHIVLVARNESIQHVSTLKLFFCEELRRVQACLSDWFPHHAFCVWSTWNKRDVSACFARINIFWLSLLRLVGFWVV
jgi:hypothetical protein